MVSFTFAGYKIYYSGSIRGVAEQDRELPWRLVQYMIKHGAEVLSEHVAARDPEEMRRIRTTHMQGVDIDSHPRPWELVRAQDIAWVDEATHMVALVNAPSHGVGMEIQRALDKPLMGLNFTPILCLVHEDYLDSQKLTWMIKGVVTPGFFVKGYRGQASAERMIFEFLTENRI